jgi:Putative DNA-binding domain
MDVPKSLDDLRALINNQVPEDLHLDYKRSAALEKRPEDVKTDLAKDVFAFANSDGGVIVYGIVEENKIPKTVDTGVDHSTWSRERIESVINANISPRVDQFFLDLFVVQHGVNSSGFRAVARRANRTFVERDQEVRAARL